jgi:hypothetical protein
MPTETLTPWGGWRCCPKAWKPLPIDVEAGMGGTLIMHVCSWVGSSLLLRLCDCGVL